MSGIGIYAMHHDTSVTALKMIEIKMPHHGGVRDCIASFSVFMPETHRNFKNIMTQSIVSAFQNESGGSVMEPLRRMRGGFESRLLHSSD